MDKFDPNEIYKSLVRAGETWANAESIAQQLEKMEKPMLSNLKLSAPDKSEAARTTWAQAQEEYRNHLEGMVEARKLANLARVRYKAMEVLAELRRTEQSNHRAAMRN